MNGVKNELCVGLEKRVRELEECVKNLASLCRAFGARENWIEIEEAERLLNEW